MEKNGRASKSSEFSDLEDTNEKLLVLPLGEKSKKITQVITNDTARQIIELLADQSMSASDIANKLDIPLTTIKYNIENLVDVGLVKIERIKYSEKGRQVKIYAPVRKLIVLVPEKTDYTSITEVLKKYLGVIFAAIFASGIVEMLTGNYAGPKSSMVPPSSPGVLNYAVSEDLEVANISSAKDAIDGTLINSALNGTAGKAIANESGVSELSNGAKEVFEMVTATPTQMATEMPTAMPAPTQLANDYFHLAGSGIAPHPGLWFLAGCLFIISLVIIADYYRRNKTN